MVVIRKAEEKDLEGVLEICEEYTPLIPYDIPYDRESCIETFNTLMTMDKVGVGVLIVADIDNEIAGCIGALKNPMFFNKKYTQCMHWFAYVKPKYRGTGAGGKLFAAFDEWSGDAEGTFQTVGAMINQQETIDWYKTKGYTLREYSLARGV